MARPSLYECYSGLTDYLQEKKLVQSQPIVTDRGGIDTCPMLLEPLNGMYVTASKCTSYPKGLRWQGNLAVMLSSFGFHIPASWYRLLSLDGLKN